MKEMKRKLERMERRSFLGFLGGVAGLTGLSPLLAKIGGGISKHTSLCLLGDCLLFRRMRDLRDPALLEMAAILREADCTWANCEIVIAETRGLHPASKGGDPHSYSPPWAADELAWLGVDIVGLANNHIMDFGEDGLFETVKHLDRVGIRHAGAGADLAQASRPAYYDGPGGRVGLVSFASTYTPGHEAAPAHPLLRGRPGLQPLNVDYVMEVERELFERFRQLNREFAELMGYGEYMPPDMDEAEVIPVDSFSVTATDKGVGIQMNARQADVDRILQGVAISRANARITLAAIHSHEAYQNFETPPRFLPPLARQCIDSGAAAFAVSGPHRLRGIEIYQGKPIFYSLGNAIFHVGSTEVFPAELLATHGLDPNTLDGSKLFDKLSLFDKDIRFWRSVIPRLQFEDESLTRVELFPITHGFGLPRHMRGNPLLAKGEEARTIIGELAELSKPWGTPIEFRDGIGVIDLR